MRGRNVLGGGDVRILRASALGGIVGPAMFTAVVLVAGGLRPGYSHLHQFISELGATGTPGSAFMNQAGFLATGILLLLFAVSTRSLIRADPAAALGSVLFHFFAIGVFIAGLVRCDAGCPIAKGSLPNLLHGFASPVAFLCAVGSMGCFGWALRRRPEWVALGRFSLGSAVLALVFMLLLSAALVTREWVGLWQRLLLATVFAWCVVVAVRIRRPNVDSA